GWRLIKCGYAYSEPEHTKLGVLTRRSRCNTKHQRHDVPRLCRLDDGINPEIRSKVVCRLKRFIFFTDRLFERFLVFIGPCDAFALLYLCPHLGQYTGGLFRAHDGCASSWPHEHRIWLEWPTQHRQIASTIGAACDDCV